MNFHDRPQQDLKRKYKKRFPLTNFADFPDSALRKIHTDGKIRSQNILLGLLLRFLRFEFWANFQFIITAGKLEIEIRQLKNGNINLTKFSKIY